MKDPLQLIRILFECWGEIVQLNAYPTNNQIIQLLEAFITYPPMQQYFSNLSDHGKTFWVDFKHFIQCLCSVIQNKNQHELLQSVLYHIGLAFKSKEEGVRGDAGKHVSWLIFLFYTSNHFKSILKTGSNLLKQLFPKSDKIPENQSDVKALEKSDDTLLDASQMPIPQVNTISTDEFSMHDKPRRSDSNITNQSMDSDIPMDATSYYRNSFPSVWKDEAREERRLSIAILVWLDEILSDSQINEYPLKIVRRARELLRLMRCNSSTIYRPYFVEAMSELKMLLESMAPFFKFSEFDSVMEFFSVKLLHDHDLYEMAVMLLDFFEKVILEGAYRKSDQAVYRGSTLIQQLRDIHHEKYAKEFDILVDQLSNFITCLLNDHQTLELLGYSEKLLQDIATETLQGFDSFLLQDFILIILPMFALEFYSVSIPLTSTVYRNWNILIQPFNFPTITAVPDEIVVSTNHLFKIGLQHMQSQSSKTLCITLRRLKPIICNVNYMLCSLRGIPIRDQGAVDVNFENNGIDVDLVFSIDEANACPFVLIDSRVTIHSLTLSFQKTRFPIMSKMVRKRIERKVRKHLEEILEFKLVESCLVVSNLTRWIRIKLLSWKSSTSSDEELHERISKELADFLKELGLKKQRYEEERRMQIGSQSDDEAPTHTTNQEDLQFLPWASPKFSVLQTS